MAELRDLQVNQMAKKKKQTMLHKILRRLGGAALMLFCLFLLASLLFYHRFDPAVNVAGGESVHNYLGSAGAVTADWILTAFGVVLPIFLIAPLIWGYQSLRLREFINPYSRGVSWVLGIISGTAFMANLPHPGGFNLGGIFGETIIRYLMTAVNAVYPYAFGDVITGAVLLVLTWFFFDYAAGITGKDWWRWFKAFVTAVYRFVNVWCRYLFKGLKFVAGIRNLRQIRGERSEPVVENDDGDVKKKKDKASKIRKEPKLSGDAATEEAAAKEISKSKTAAKSINKKIKDADDGYHYPSINLLSRPADKTGSNISQKELDETARELESVLEEFGVHGKIVKVRPGPVVTLYELEPAPGTKTARVIGLADDIARSMSAVSVRIAVVPGSNTIGIEMPNKNRETVWLRDLFEDDNFQLSKNELNVVLGKDIGGRNVYADLTKMPHLLVAGTTGSGKSVGVNSMILSLLFKMRPEECKLIMIDPKMLEFSMYNGIPHLLTPVITDPSKAVIGLKWAVKEMEDRYRAMAQLNVRNIMGYNQKLKELKASGEVIKRTVQTGFDMETGKPIYEEQELDLTPLPYIVIVVDEMADLMLVAGKDVEAAIQRLAQMARAAGLHLIMSTQRPSVDVITGTIKANFPTRISFQVTSKIDSRTILGEQGAEQLLGRGDMLYMPAGQRPQRIHGAFVKDSEVEQIVEFIKEQKAPEYVEGVTEGELSNGKDSGGAVFDKGDFGSGSDEDLYAQAVAIVQADKKASTSYIQRRLRIGYNRAASLIDKMEAEGIVSAPDHVGRREVL